MTIGSASSGCLSWGVRDAPPCPEIPILERPTLENILPGPLSTEDGVVVSYEDWDRIKRNLARLQVAVEDYEALVNSYNETQ